MADKHQNRDKRLTLDEILNQDGKAAKGQMQKYWRKWKGASKKAKTTTDSA